MSVNVTSNMTTNPVMSFIDVLSIMTVMSIITQKPPVRVAFVKL